MINSVEKEFDPASPEGYNWASKLAKWVRQSHHKRIKARSKKLIERLGAYFKRLLFPLYLFPIKLVTYTIYYILRSSINIFVAFVDLLTDCVLYPFANLKNFLKSIFALIVGLYLVASLFVITDYLNKEYGWWGKFLCSYGVRELMQDSVVRIVGGYSEGSGFLIAKNQILTNFHVIADEPSPKIVFPDGTFTTPVRIVGDKEIDLAVLFTEEQYPKMVLPLPDRIYLNADEPLIAVGYPLGTNLTGRATQLKGRFIDFRLSKKDPIGYIQTDISLVNGMSGGPLVDQCGSVVGISTTSLAGLSLFANADWAKSVVPYFTDQNITKIEVDPSASPEDAVKTFYTYLKARRMEDGFNLLSSEYLKRTNYEEWTTRFKDILDVSVYKSVRYENTADSASVKFSTKNWSDGEAEYHYYEGTWQTIKEDGIYKMHEADIEEIYSPSWDWFYQ